MTTRRGTPSRAGDRRRRDGVGRRDDRAEHERGLPRHARDDRVDADRDRDARRQHEADRQQRDRRDVLRAGRAARRRTPRSRGAAAGRSAGRAPGRARRPACPGSTPIASPPSTRKIGYGTFSTRASVTSAATASSSPATMISVCVSVIPARLLAAWGANPIAGRGRVADEVSAACSDLLKGLSPMPRFLATTHDLPAGPPPEVLEQIDVAWERARELFASDLELHFEVDARSAPCGPSCAVRRRGGGRAPLGVRGAGARLRRRGRRPRARRLSARRRASPALGLDPVRGAPVRCAHASHPRPPHRRRARAAARHQPARAHSGSTSSSRRSRPTSCSRPDSRTRSGGRGSSSPSPAPPGCSTRTAARSS